MMGVSLMIVSLVPVLRALGPRADRLHVCGLAAGLLLLPWSLWEEALGPLSMNFSTWIAAGLMIVVGAVWVIVFNADLPRARHADLRPIRSLAPILKISMAYPLANRFDGHDLAMFTLVVFTLVTGVASNGSFIHAIQNEETFGGGFNVRRAPADDAHHRHRAGRCPGLRDEDVAVAASQSFLPIEATQKGTGRLLERTSCAGSTRPSGHTTFDLGKVAEGYGSRDVWKALARSRTSRWSTQHRRPAARQLQLRRALDFRLSGFYFDEGIVRVDPDRGTRSPDRADVELTVIGILSDTTPPEMAGISTSQKTLDLAFQAAPTRPSSTSTSGPGRPGRGGHGLESAFLGYGMEAESIQQVMADVTAGSVTFNRLIQGFMGLGLLVGVAALGVISARSVVERRQQIGVMRALGFRRRMVEASFLLESSFLASRRSSWARCRADARLEHHRRPAARAELGNLTLVVPWLNLLVIFVLVYAVAMVATIAPARRSREGAPGRSAPLRVI